MTLYEVYKLLGVYINRVKKERRPAR